MAQPILWFREVTKADLPSVGGKGASLGEMSHAGIPVPPGFVVTAEVYRDFLCCGDLNATIRDLLTNLDPEDSQILDETAQKIKQAVMAQPMSAEAVRAIREAYEQLGGAVAVRSSATAEDLPEASFAGQQSTFLNVEGAENVIQAVQQCWASLFEPRAIFYRVQRGFDHMTVSIAVVVQKMVQSESSGVMFTKDPLHNDGTKIVIESVYGLGEAIVSGALTPDLYVVDKGTLKMAEQRVARQPWKLVRNPQAAEDLDDANIRVNVPHEEQERHKVEPADIEELARLGRHIEEHYGLAQDIEWAKADGRLYILQSRPVTTNNELPDELKLVSAQVLLNGSGASPGIRAGQVRLIRQVSELHKIQKGDVLVTEMTTPDFVPAMKRATAIVTDQGGRTCHAAIVSRELGIPCVVGTEMATSVLKDGQWVTVNGTQGVVYDGRIELKQERETKRPVAKTATRVYVNLADPELADVIAKRPVDGVGLLRAEFIIAHIGEHPRYMLDSGRGQEWTDKLARGIQAFAKAFHPRPVVYRATDFKTNEYRNLKGGSQYEPVEENPMIGYRGASRYIREREVFALEAAAIRRVREQYDNLYVMVPFVRTPEELAGVRDLLAEEGLRRKDGLKLWMMVEIPSNVILLDAFIDVGIDGISIGSNDLTQLVLGIDRDNARFHDAFDERNPAVLWCLQEIITKASQRGVTTSICGQAPSFYPELTKQLVERGITSVSVSPDMIEQTRRIIARAEKDLGRLPPQEAPAKALAGGSAGI
ncbi:MAG: phosphoenolpyruvate synthase [Chloroflexi bacterium]|nr:phosphoenolpyruvate synthase [Chloroflexota bacterium]